MMKNKLSVEQRQNDYSGIWTNDLWINVLALYKLSYLSLMLAVSIICQWLCSGWQLDAVEPLVNFCVARDHTQVYDTNWETSAEGSP